MPESIISHENPPENIPTIVFRPIISIADGNPIVGMFSGGFSWDIMLSGILHSNYKQVRCVVTSYESKFTIF